MSDQAASTLGWSARAVAAAVRAGEVTAQQVVSDHLHAVASAEDRLQAWAYLDPDAALETAAAIDSDPASAGPLAGVPFGVKDIIDVAGMPTANGADIPVERHASTDAAVVARLREAGAVPFGKTVTTEFALFRPGPTTNPHDPSRTPGGSSSGSAAAVGAGTIPLALGTQTAGSVVRPASYCGIVGVKPTLGTVPREGVTLCSSSLDTIGLFGRDAGDVGLGLDAMAGGYASFTPSDLGDHPRLGFTRTFEWDLLEPSTRSVIEAAIERLAEQVEVVEVTLPDALQGMANAQRAIMEVEVVDHLAVVRARHGDLLSAQLLRLLDAGEGWRWAYEAALTHARTGRDHLGGMFAEVDAIIAPAVLGEPPSIETTGDPLLCRQWTLLGTPTVAVPGLTGPSGLPLGIQTVAAPGRDDLALGAADLVTRLLAG
ncbi:MAG: amidase [Nitriliruptoraceae bacterium]